jgi:leucyl aminopeptidase
MLMLMLMLMLTATTTIQGRYGGASTAAAFLQRFIKPTVRWAHLDVAGPAMYSETRKFMPKGSTGFGVALLVEYLRSTSRK